MRQCGKRTKNSRIIKLGGRGSCIRKIGHGGPCRWDLTGLELPYIVVLRPSGFKISPSGHKYFTWMVKHKTSGKISRVLHYDLVSGRTGNSSSCAGGSGAFDGRKHVPEYVTVAFHYGCIFNPTYRGYKNYKGMPFYKPWNPKEGGSLLSAYFWIVENLGRRPKGRWSLDIINHSKGFVPGNLRWVPPGSSIQANNQVHRTVFDVSDKVFSVEAKRRGYGKL